MWLLLVQNVVLKKAFQENTEVRSSLLSGKNYQENFYYT